MSARRRISIECDGPTCNQVLVTVENKVMPARESAKRAGWHRVGHAAPRSLDFCTPECEQAYTNERWPS